MPIRGVARGTGRAAILICALAACATLAVGSPAGADPFSPPRLATPSCGALPAFKPSMRLSGTGRRLRLAAPLRVLSIGSSSTQGIGASSAANSYPARLEADLRARWPQLPIAVTNAGIGGERAGATVERLERLVATRSYDLVIWQLGTNDAVSGDDPEGFRKLTLRGIAAVRAAGDDLILLDPQYFPGIRDLARYERFVAVVREVGENEHVPVFERYAMMKGWK